MMNKKGLIIPAAGLIKDEEDSTSFVSNGIDSAIIRNWIIFWDEFICPDNNFVSLGLPPELKYLKDNNLLQHEVVPFSGSISGGDFSKLFLKAQELIYNKRSKEEPGKWTMAQTEGIITGSHRSPNIEPCLVFDLVNSIHLPDRLVSIEDILNFKSKRKDELIQFHVYLEEIYLRIASSKDIPRSKTYELQKLERAIADYNKVLKESFPKRILSSLRIVLDRSLINSASFAMGAASLAPTVGLESLNTGIMAGFAAFGIQNVLTELNSERNTHPLTYITKIETELY